MRLTDVHMKNFEAYKPYIDTLILPIGAIEAHGPHAPLGTDVLIPQQIADYLEGKLSGRIWTAPAIPYGHCAVLKDFPGTIDVPGRILADYVHAVVASFARFDLKHVVLLNGHGGNSAALQEVAMRLTELKLDVLVSNYWLDYREEIQEIAPGVGHGGEDETSLVLAIAPNTVDLSLAGNHEIEVDTRARFQGMGQSLYPEGFSGNAAAATEEKGARLLQLIGDRLHQEITKMWARNS
ncbi:creatininase family protein [Tumebacillus lipolyticus]|uniref:Creatininase family protein n=1 Tax=Tumebacillus lipolyticus TaxID=1280370 RepID=A0ABW5A174_9BACL